MNISFTFQKKVTIKNITSVLVGLGPCARSRAQSGGREVGPWVLRRRGVNELSPSNLNSNVKILPTC